MNINVVGIDLCHLKEKYNYWCRVRTNLYSSWLQVLFLIRNRDLNVSFPQPRTVKLNDRGVEAPFNI